VFPSIRRAWIFLKQSWTFGQRSSGLLLPTLLSFLVSMVSLLVFLVPLTGLVVYIRKTLWGQFAIGALIGMLLVLLVGIFNLFTFMTAYLAGMKMRGNTVTTSQAWLRIIGLDGSLFWISMGIPLESFRAELVSLLSRRRQPNGWKRVLHLLVPVAAIEVNNLGEVSTRMKYFLKENCLFSANSVGIKVLNMLLMAGAAVVGLLAGFGGMALVLHMVKDPSLARGLAFVVASVVLAVFLLPVASLTRYTQTLFNVCLYQWGLNVLEARKAGSSTMAVVPDPLAIALGLKSGR
jgi:hypothetical protein